MFCLLSFNSYAQAPTFTLSNTPPPDNIYSIVKDPVNTSEMYACSIINVLRSVDKGKSWNKTANPIGSINTLYISPSGQLYTGTTTGIYQYNKVANSWTAISTSSLINVTAIIEDASNNLYAGTGTTGNPIVTNTNPINYGTGIYKYASGTTWNAINTGINILPNATVRPYIKAFALLKTGEIVAATYGNGVLKYDGTAWSTYGTGISNTYVNSLAVNSAGTLYAGTDIGVSSNSGASWSANTALKTPNKPVRTLAITSAGKIYAGLGFYHYQKGSIVGEIFSTTNNGTFWQNDGAYFNSTSILSMAVNSNDEVLAGACGIWSQPSTGGGVWRSSFTLLNSLKVPNHIYRLVKNSKGHLFAMCNNVMGNVLGYGGVFRSTDQGATWVSVNTGINLSLIHI